MAFQPTALLKCYGIYATLSLKSLPTAMHVQASKKSGRSEQNCYLCGKVAQTKDHIPPAGIFPKPRPHNLITVPACAECNNSKSLDDEYFRLTVAAISQDSPQSHVLLKQRILPRVGNSLAFIKAFLNSVQKVPVVDLAGNVIGNVPAVSFDRPRMQTVVDKIVRGLFLKHTGRRLELSYRVEDFLVNPIPTENFQKTIASLPLFEIGDGSVFSYRYHLSEEMENESYWFLMFYNDSTLFVTKTSSSEEP